MSDFLNGMSEFFERGSGENSTRATCKSDIDFHKFYQFSLIPAVIITLLLASTKKRRNVLLSRLGGRIGLVHPMDTMTRSLQLSYACAFGATALLVYDIVWNQRLAVDYNGPPALRTCMAILSMLIYGLVYFPVFACLALGTAFSFGLGSLYSWMFTAVEFYRLSECNLTSTGRAIIIIRYLPVVLCDVFLSISFPVRFGFACYHRNFFTSDEDLEERRETVEEIRKSYQGQHVRKLLKKPPVPPLPEGCSEKVQEVVYNLTKKLIYHREKGFRYPSRLLSVMFVAGIVVYVVTVEFLTVTFSILDAVLKGISDEVEYIDGWYVHPGETQNVTEYRNDLLVAYYYADLLRTCLIVSISVACFISFVTMLHMLTSFRENLYAMYRGDYRIIPSPYEKSAPSLCVGCIKYAGFQVAYIAWSYIIVVLILFIISLGLGILITLIIDGKYQWLLDRFFQILPGIVLAVVLMLGQTLVAKYVFLQENGAWLRLDNRRFFFIFTFFMFFYNIFLGLASCLLRIVKAIAVGTIFLARLDNSTLPRRFEFFDPGFAAYQGFIHLEAAHTHPVVNVFIRLLSALSKQRHSSKSSAIDDGTIKVEMSKIGRKKTISNGDLNNDPEKPDKPVNVSARFNWLVTYTLLNNPQIRVYRKGFIQSMEKAKKEGIRIPISDSPITDFDLVKALEQREKERQLELDMKKSLLMEGLGSSISSLTLGAGSDNKCHHMNGSAPNKIDNKAKKNLCGDRKAGEKEHDRTRTEMENCTAPEESEDGDINDIDIDFSRNSRDHFVMMSNV